MLTIIAVYIAVGIAVITALNYTDHLCIGSICAKIMAVVLWPVVAVIAYLMRNWKLW